MVCNTRSYTALAIRVLAATIPAAIAFSCTVPLADAAGPDVDVSSQALVPTQGASDTLDIASWNIEWFGDAANGPSNAALQRQNAYDVIAGSSMDVWGVAEIVSTSEFNQLKSQLAGYAGFLSNDASVVNGSAYYSASEQKVGILYKTSLASVLDARVILTGSDASFAGRPPLQVTLRVTLNGTTEDIVVVVLHAKCCDDNTSWTRRQAAATALKSYLDSNYPSQKVWVIGDFNDDLDTSITAGQASPYTNFLNDGADYTFPSLALSNAHIASTVDYPDTIDHHLITNEAQARYISGSIRVFPADQYIANYGDTTSDHYPVFSRYSWPGGGGTSGTGGAGGTGGGGGGTAQLTINEICANEPGSDTAGEFVEIVNIGSAAANLGGYTISDGSSVRHTFAATTLAAGSAIVVFGATSGIPGGTPNAVGASTGNLNLGNSGDSVTLKNASGTVIQSYTYSSALASSDGVSINRSPDGSASGSFVKHNTLSSLSRSAGLRASGGAW